MIGENPTHVEINLKAFAGNLERIHRWVGPSVSVIPIVKSDAYGHGLLEIVSQIPDLSDTTLGISNLEEGVRLRKAGISSDILVLEGCFKGEEEHFLTHRLQPVVYHRDQIEILRRTAERLERKIKIHIKIDTGMSRLGFAPEEGAAIVKDIEEMASVELAGLMTHFASAYNDPLYTGNQLERFRAVVDSLKKEKVFIPLIHCANSAAVLRYRESYYSAVRPGIILYGANPGMDWPLSFSVDPVMTFKTKIIQLKEVPAGTPISYGGTYITEKPSLIATLPVGYRDGYPRSLSNGVEVLIKGKRFPQVGTICMDMSMVDVTGHTGIKVGDEVVLFGCQGEGRITVEEIAQKAGTIPYELLCHIGNQVRRVYR